MGMCLLMEGEQCTQQRRLHSRRVVHKKTEHKGQPGRWGRDVTEGIREGADNFASGALMLTDGTVRGSGWLAFIFPEAYEARPLAERRYRQF